MTEPADEYCDLCDLPRATCIHGNPPPPEPPRAARTPSAPRTSRRSSASNGVVTRTAPRSVAHRWTPAEAFRPHILALLAEHRAPVDTEEFHRQLEERLDGVLTVGDREASPEGGQRWQVAVRKQRKQLIDEGLLVPARPGLWELTDRGRATAT